MLDANAILTSRANAQAVKIAEGLRFTTLQEALDQMKGSSLPPDLVGHFTELLTAKADAALRGAADSLASEAFALGRHDEATVFKEDIAVATYTALLDENTCDPCSEADGSETEFGSAEYERLSPPYGECDSADAPGGNRCRCQFVFTLKTEERSGPVPLAPTAPHAPFPPMPAIGIMPPLLPSDPVLPVAKAIAEKARAEEPAITKAVVEIATAARGEMDDLDFRLKTEGSLTRKIATDPKLVALGPARAQEGIADAVRYTIKFDEADYADGAARTREAFLKQYEEVKWKNYWTDPTNPYQGINAVYRTKTGQMFEVQFHTPESLDVKLTKSHTLYEKLRLATDPTEIKHWNDEIAKVWADVAVPRGVLTNPAIGDLAPVFAPTAPLAPPRIEPLPPLPRLLEPRADQLEAYRARLAERDLRAIHETSEVFSDRKIVILPAGDRNRVAGFDVGSSGMRVTTIKDTIIVIPAKYALGSGTTGSIYHPDLYDLRKALEKARRGSALPIEVYRLAGYSPEHIAEIEKARELEKQVKAALPRVKKAPPAPIEITTGVPYVARTPHPYTEAFGIPASPAIDKAMTLPAYVKPEMSKADAQRWITETMPNAKASMNLTDRRMLPEAYGEINRLNTIFPAVGRTFSEIGSKPVSPGTIAYVSYVPQLKDTQTMFLGAKRWNDPNALVRGAQMGMESHWIVPGAGTPAAVLTHEYGHAIDNYIKWHGSDVLKAGPDKGKFVVSVMDRYRQRITFSPTKTDSEMRAIGAMRQVDRTTISGYAARAYQSGGNGDAESFAEAFSSLSWSPIAQRSPSAVALHEMLKSLIEGGLFQ